MKTYRVVLMLGLVASVLLPAVATMAQQGDRRISIDFRDEPLTDVLQSLRAAGGPASVNLPEKAGDRLVTVAIVDKTVPQALALVCSAVGLTLTEANGVYTATDKPAAVAIDRPATPALGPISSDLLRTPPMAARPEPSPLETGKGIATTAGTTAGAATKKDKIYRLITPNYANLMMLADMFGGSYVSEDNYRNSTNGGGGYGNSGNGNNGYGNNGSNGSSNRGSSRGGFNGSASGVRTNTSSGNYGY